MTGIRIGCSGWSYKHWEQPFYRGAPPSAWLRRYAEAFDTVELNASFYRLPTRRAAERWASATPPGFVFAVKASRYLTHVRRLREVGEGARLLLDRVAPLVEAGKLGPILWQLPESFTRDEALLDRALADLPAGRHAVEFRHASWFCGDVMSVLRAHGAALVIGDHPSRPFQSLERTADFVYVRFHFGRQEPDGRYGRAELDRWADRVAGWARDATVYAYFNNDWNASAPANARTLLGMVGQRRPLARTVTERG